MMQNTERDAEEARKRFGDYREIDIKFKKPMTLNHPADHARLERIWELIKYTGGEAGAYSTHTYDHNFSLNHVKQQEEHSFLENTMTVLEKTNDKLFVEDSASKQIHSSRLDK